MYESPDINVADKISSYMNLILTCIFYAPIIPIGIPCAAIGSGLNYFSYKYLLLNHSKKPDAFSTLMADFFISLMPFVLMIWTLSYSIFVDLMNDHYNAGPLREFRMLKHDDDDGDDIVCKEFPCRLYKDDYTSDILKWSMIAVAAYLLIPSNLFVEKCCSKKKEMRKKDTESEYRSVFLSFPQDYDKENPITNRRGQERFIQMQVEKV